MEALELKPWELDELHGILAEIYLPTFSEREREIATLAVKLTLFRLRGKASPVPRTEVE